jgi:hypothetical protein
MGFAEQGTFDMNAILQLHRVAFATVLAGGAGIRATVPLLIMSLAHLVDSGDVPLSDAMKWLGHWYICAGLAVLLVIEVFADMIPSVDHAIHACLTPIYPIVGAVVAAAPLYGGGAMTHIPMAAFGALLALVSHGGKSLIRTGTSSATCGSGNSLQSACGTLTLIAVCVIAIVVAYIALVLAVVVVAGCIFAAVKLRQAAQKPPAMRKPVMPVLAAVRWRRATKHHHNQTNVNPQPHALHDKGATLADMRPNQTGVVALTPQALRTQNDAGLPMSTPSEPPV